MAEAMSAAAAATVDLAAAHERLLCFAGRGIDGKYTVRSIAFRGRGVNIGKLLDYVQCCVVVVRPQMLAIRPIHLDLVQDRLDVGLAVLPVTSRSFRSSRHSCITARIASSPVKTGRDGHPDL